MNPEKRNYDAGLPITNAPFNLCVRHGDLIFISGLPPFDEEFSRAVREAREQGRPVPSFPNPPFAFFLGLRSRTLICGLLALLDFFIWSFRC